MTRVTGTAPATGFIQLLRYSHGEPTTGFLLEFRWRKTPFLLPQNHSLISKSIFHKYDIWAILGHFDGLNFLVNVNIAMENHHAING